MPRQTVLAALASTTIKGVMRRGKKAQCRRPRCKMHNMRQFKPRCTHEICLLGCATHTECLVSLKSCTEAPSPDNATDHYTELLSIDIIRGNRWCLLSALCNLFKPLQAGANLWLARITYDLLLATSMPNLFIYLPSCRKSRHQHFTHTGIEHSLQREQQIAMQLHASSCPAQARCIATSVGWRAACLLPVCECAS